MIKRFNPDFSMSISHELAYMRETPEGGYVAHGDYATLFSELEVVKAERDALAVENAALKKSLIAISLAEPIDGETIVCDFDTLVSIAAGALTTPATDAALAAIDARVWAEAKDFAKSMLATDSADHIDFLFDGKIQQLKETK
ncbi:TPA: hypothetical protein SMI07_001853 [Serratia liquefaciens]|nr:hypothetical protein [Serratia liquefaciens]